jgi:hypothetical protein
LNVRPWPFDQDRVTGCFGVRISESAVHTVVGVGSAIVEPLGATQPNSA